jgi:hypothetical protein
VPALISRSTALGMSTEANICGSKSKSPMAERAISGDVFETIEFDILLHK